MVIRLTFLIEKTYAALRTVAMLVFLIAPVLSQAQHANISGNLVQLPRVWAEGLVYQIEFRLMGDARPLLFELVRATPTDSILDTDGIFEDGVLTIKSIDVGGTPYWARLGVLSLDPVVFELLSGGVDDEDDDNDGLEDYFDEKPWTPEFCNISLCMKEPSSTGPERDSFYKGYTDDPRAPTVDLGD